MDEPIARALTGDGITVEEKVSVLVGDEIGITI